MESDAERRAIRLAVVLLRYLPGQSQREVGAISGVDQRRWSRYELGDVTPRRNTLDRLSRAVGVSPSRLDQLLGILGQICEETGGRGSRTSAQVESDGAEPEEGPSFRQVAAALAERLEPLITESVTELEALAGASHEPKEELPKS